jgi:hypothetical protein
MASGDFYYLLILLLEITKFVYEYVYQRIPPFSNAGKSNLIPPRDNCHTVCLVVPAHD